jgi:hypothetical protein
MFRDLHRLLAPSVLAMVLLAALGLGSIIERAARGHLALRLPLVVIVPAALALVLVPGGPDRVRSAYEPRPFSSEWPTVMSAVDNGRVLSLPWQPLRRTEWMAQSFLDPSAKALAGRVLVDRTLTIARDGTRIRVVDVEGAGGDDTLGAWLTRGDGDPLPSGLLAGSDIEHVVIWKGSPGAVPARPPDWTTTFSGTDFVVWSDPRAASR